MSLQQQHLYSEVRQGAFALNNTAVQMITCGQVSDALCALKDGLFALRRANSHLLLENSSNDEKDSNMGNDSQSEEDDEEAAELAEFVRKSLYSASVRLARRVSWKDEGHDRNEEDHERGDVYEDSSSSIPMVSVVESHSISALQSAIHHAQTTMYDSSSPQSSPSASVTAILIRETLLSDDASLFPMVHADPELGILLYNFGLACFLRSLMCRDDDDDDDDENDDGPEQEDKESVGPCPPPPRPSSSSSSSQPAHYYATLSDRSLILANATFANLLEEHERQQKQQSHPLNSGEIIFCAMALVAGTAQLFGASQQHDRAVQARELVQDMLFQAEEDYPLHFLLETRDFVVGAAAA